MNDAVPDSTVELVVNAALRLASDHPAAFGRMRAARIIAGHRNVRDPGRADIDTGIYLVPEAAKLDLRQMVTIIDAVFEFGYLVSSYGPRPRMCLTRKGWAHISGLESKTRVASNQMEFTL